jgi:hypothetical protein
MKHIQILLLCLIINFAKGQTVTEWFPIGAEYYYDYITYNQIGGPNDSGFFKLSVQKDTFINPKNCKVLAGQSTDGSGRTSMYHEKFYVYESNNEVYRFYKNDFFKIYDFNLTVGDSISFPSPKVNSTCDTIKCFIDSIKLEPKYGNLKIQYFHFNKICKQPRVASNYNIEFMGHELFMFTNDFIVPDAAEPTSLRCYKDFTNNINYTERDCEFRSTSILNQKKLDFVKVYPNPSTDYLIIENQLNEATNIHILNNVGQIMKTIQLEKGINKMDITDLNIGIYFYTIRIIDQVQAGKIVRM